MMAAAPVFMLGFAELLILLSGGGLLGVPPGERDAALLRSAPNDALVYIEWAERASGKPGAPGIDGLAADPEVTAFIQDVERAVRTAVEKGAANDDRAEQILAKAIPDLVKAALNHSGCLSVSYDPKAAAKAEPDAPGRAQAQFGTWASILPGIKATLIINAADDADKVAQSVTELLELLPAELRSKDLQKQNLPLPLPGAELTLHRHKNYFIVGFGEGSVDRAIAALSGKPQGLAANKRFAKAISNVSMKRTAGVSWLDVKGLVDQIAAAAGVQGAMLKGMVSMVGADAIDSIATSTGVVDGQIRTKSFITTGGRTEGILVLAAGRAIKPADLALVPGDADFVAALSLSAPKILATVKGIIGKADPDSRKAFDGVLGQMEDRLGLSLEDDVFKAFGDVWVLHDSPAAGGVFVTSLVGSLEVRDPQKASDVFTKLMAFLKASLPEPQRGQFRRRGVVLAQKKFMDRTIYYVNIIGDDVPFTPAFCLTDKQLLFAPHPQALKAHLRFLAGREANFSARLEKELAPPKGDLMMFSYFDSKSLVRYLYAVAPYLGQMLASELQSEGGEVDVFSLPSARAILPYIGDSFGAVVRTPDGILSESQNGLPIPGGVGVLTSLPMLFYSQMGYRTLQGPVRIQRLNAVPKPPRAVGVRAVGVKRAVPAKAVIKVKANKQARPKKPAKRKAAVGKKPGAA